MRISAVTQPFSAELRKMEASRKVEKDAKTSKLSDRSDISSNAQALNEASAKNTISAAISSMSEIRSERIADVRSKIESGYYNSEEFLDKLAEKLLNEFGLKNSDG